MAQTQGMTLDQFLGHQTRAGGGTQFLRGWRKRNPPAVDVFLHRRAPIVALWQHNVPRIYEKDLGGGRHANLVYGGSWNCLEHEEVLQKQYRRDDDGNRAMPPVVCPVCRLQEKLYELYHSGDLGFCDPVFRWQGDDPKDVQVLTVGGMLKLYERDDLTDEEKQAMQDAGVSLRQAWKENVHAKCNYLFVVVDAGSPEGGVQIAVETTALGDAVKRVIRDRMTSAGERDGNPLINPYCIRWEHHPNEAAFDKKYNALPMERIALTPQVQQLIDGDPPDTDHVTRAGNVATLRAQLERRCVLPDPNLLDWDDIFGPAEKAGYGNTPESSAQPPEEPSSAAQPPAQSKSDGKGKSKSKRSRKKKAPAKPQVDCDECGKPMDEDAAVCPHCGAEYELEPAGNDYVSGGREAAEEAAASAKGEGWKPNF